MVLVSLLIEIYMYLPLKFQSCFLLLLLCYAPFFLSVTNNKGQQLLNYTKERYGSCKLHFSASRSIYQGRFKLKQFLCYALDRIFVNPQ